MLGGVALEHGLGDGFEEACVDEFDSVDAAGASAGAVAGDDLDVKAEWVFVVGGEREDAAGEVDPGG